MNKTRVLVALGGNAIAPPGADDPGSQRDAVGAAMQSVAALVLEGYDVALTHGNGPQVGNLMIKNQIARDVVPAVPLDWAVAQTQATIGYLLVSALEMELRKAGSLRPVATLLTRVRVDSDDPAFEDPTKPIGRYASADEARERIEEGEAWRESGERGWRRVVPSPEPQEILDQEAALSLLERGTVIVSTGGGGIPMVRTANGLEGVEAVLDKDLSAALLAQAISAECLVIATDVEAAAIRYGTAEQEWLGRVTPDDLRGLAAEGEFAAGSMGPKVEACARFVEATDGRAVITSLESLREGVAGVTGTVVESVAP
ncbi:MAG: carbamate kinase [Solirubrobacterales bacterium]